MNRRRVVVDIGRIVVDGLDISPDRAPRLRDHTTLEVQRILHGESWAGRSRVVGRIVAQPLMLADGPLSEGALAAGLAQRIGAVLQGEQHDL